MGYEALTKRVEETAAPEADVSAIVGEVIGKVGTALANRQGGREEIYVDIPQLAKSEVIHHKNPVIGTLAAEQEKIVGEIAEAVKATSIPGFHAMSIAQNGTISVAFN